MRVSIFGLGYVGAVVSACLSESGHDIIAIDKDPIKVKCLQEGRSPIIEADLSELIQRNVAAGRLKATLSAEEAVYGSDISLVCVGTPSNKDGSLKLDYVKECCREIGELLKDKKTYHTVVLRSTVLPGTAKTMAIPTLEKASGKKVGEEFGFANNPEFLREGTAIYDYFNPPKIVVGASDEQASQMVFDLYEGISAPAIATDVEVAEGVKYADNAWHAMKVGFANELGNILKEHGVDSHKVMDIFCEDKKLNISKAYLKPGFAFGGSCLPKDVRAIRASAQAKGLQTPIFNALLEANIEQVHRAHEMVVQSGGKKVGLLGLSFKAGTDDLRESPLVTLADRLLKDGYELKIYDPCVYEAAHMDGANQQYIREKIPHISRCLIEKPEELLDGTDVYIVGNKGGDFAAILEQAEDDTPIIDLVRLGNGLESRQAYNGICW